MSFNLPNLLANMAVKRTAQSFALGSLRASHRGRRLPLR